MNKVIQAVIGVLFASLGFLICCAAVYIMLLAKSVTMWGVVLVGAGFGMLFWGGVMVPYSGVEAGAQKLVIFVNPWLDYLPGGRRRTDQLPVIPTPVADPNVPIDSGGHE